MFLSEQDRFNTKHPDLCPRLRWKSQLVPIDPLPEDQEEEVDTSSHLYWCLMTQNCLGPDGRAAEPGPCSALDRRCHAANE